MFSYVAYGLVTFSDIEFPNLKPIHAAAQRDVTVRLGSVDHPPWQTDSNVVATDAGVFQYWHDVGTMSVRNGKEIAVDPIPALDERVLRAAVLGTGFGLLLRQRGRVVLHGSSVDIDGEAVAFVGNCGCGKSSFALALVDQGHKLIADDVTALELNGRRALAIPAFPQINVEPDAAQAFSHDVRLLDRVQPSFDKRIVPVADRFLDGNRPLTHVFELDRGDSVEVERLGFGDAFVTLLTHSYRLALFTKSQQAAYMYRLANVARIMPVFRIKVPGSLTELPAVAQRVAAFVKDGASTEEGNSGCFTNPAPRARIDGRAPY